MDERSWNFVWSLIHEYEADFFRSVRLAGGDVEVDLAGVTIRNLGLINYKFQGFDLRGTEFVKCDLRGAEFYGANLTDGKFINCVLAGADFRGSDLTGTKFDNCVLKVEEFRANFKDAIGLTTKQKLWLRLCGAIA
jgi:uncharacterized protein YjbI with pentapeptide repeats